MNMMKRELPVGAVVHERYRVERVLGSGGFGITYLVTDTRDGQRAAMKEYMPLDTALRAADGRSVRPHSESSLESYEKFRQKFLDEAQTLYRFRAHPNVVAVRHLFCENNTVYYVMEYLDGLDLEHYRRRSGGQLTWNALRPVVAQIVSALEAVHGAGLVHCDVSPDNIMLLDGRRVKLLDFGAARSMLRGTIETSMIVAKYGFAPPEQMQGRNLGPWTDVYALGATIYACVVGRRPPRCEERLAEDKIVWPTQLGLCIPSAQWETALRRAMELRRECRYQSVSAFWSALDCALRVKCLKGRMAGRERAISGEVLLGTDAARCQLVYPADSAGVDRVQLRFWTDGGALMVMDMGSRFGTRLGGRRMTAGLAYRFSPGALLEFGGEIYISSESR